MKTNRSPNWLLLWGPVAMIGGLATPARGQLPYTALQAQYRAGQYSDQYFYQTRLETKWLERESNAFGRLDFGLKRDEYRARQKKTRLEGQRHQLLNFVNGLSRPWTQAHFRRSIHQLEQTPGIAQLLQCRLPALDANEFEPNGIAFQVLQADGRLTRPPVVLLAGADGGRISRCAQAFGNAWLTAAQHLAATGFVRHEQLRRLHEALEKWRRDAEADLASASWSQRYLAKKYLMACQRLLVMADDPKCRPSLETYLSEGGFGFPGGTVAELVEHVLAHHLSLLYGGRAQLTLGELAHDMLRDLDDQIAVLEDRIEHYKAQNPAHNAAMRQRALTEDNRPSSECYDGGYSQAVVRVFTPYGTSFVAPVMIRRTMNQQPGPAPASDIAGLGSEAYSRPLPHLQNGARPVRPTTTPEKLLFLVQP